MQQEKKFKKYKLRGNANWESMMTRDFRKYNAYQQARYGWVLRMAGNIRGKRVLDLGSGGGSLTYLLAREGGDVTGVDNEELGIRFAKQNLESIDNRKLKYQFLQASAYELPFPDESFDVVVSCEVIEHLEEPERMLKEARRVLKTGGRMVLTTPYRTTEVPQDPNHVKEYFPQELLALVGKYFREAQFKSTHHMFWRSLYAYGFFGRRPFGKWVINIGSLLSGWNPFMKDYEKPAKFDMFTSIIAWGEK